MPLSTEAGINRYFEWGQRIAAVEGAICQCHFKGKDAGMPL